MTEQQLEQLRYPIGRFVFPETTDQSTLQQWINDIDALPHLLNAVTKDLTENQLDTPYRPEGWTIRQVVHHLADSHINSHVRYRLALTEDNPSILPYLEAQWALLEDAKHSPIEPSLMLLEGLHQRWVVLMNSMSADDFQRTFYHPGRGRTLTLSMNTGLYAWHGKHHVAHITRLRERYGW